MATASQKMTEMRFFERMRGARTCDERTNRTSARQRIWCEAAGLRHTAARAARARSAWVGERCDGTHSSAEERGASDEDAPRRAEDGEANGEAGADEGPRVRVDAVEHLHAAERAGRRRDANRQRLWADGGPAAAGGDE